MTRSERKAAAKARREELAENILGMVGRLMKTPKTNTEIVDAVFVYVHDLIRREPQRKSEILAARELAVKAMEDANKQREDA